MKEAIHNEKNSLKEVAVFFAIDTAKIPARKYLDGWFNNVWTNKLDIQLTFCKMIKRGIFIVFLKDHNMQDRVLKKP